MFTTHIPAFPSQLPPTPCLSTTYPVSPSRGKSGPGPEKRFTLAFPMCHNHDRFGIWFASLFGNCIPRRTVSPLTGTRSAPNVTGSVPRRPCRSAYPVPVRMSECKSPRSGFHSVRHPRVSNAPVHSERMTNVAQSDTKSRPTVGNVMGLGYWDSRYAGL